MEEAEIVSFIRKNPNLKARQIAKQLGIDRHELNSFLHSRPELFVKDEEFCWTIKELGAVTVEFENSSWVDAQSFERTLKSVGCLLSSEYSSVIFVVTKDCKILLEAAARLLALCNQLVRSNKKVAIDFSSCSSTKTYFNRIGFIDQLDPHVNVLPSRPKISAADKYKGNSDTVVEFGSICIEDRDDDIPKLLKNQFVIHAGQRYHDAAFTIFSELFDNVCEHSNSPIPGFAALQKYSHPKPHIQTVVSDSGDGIVGTLWPVLREHYPKLADKYPREDPMSGVLLLKEVLQKGRITQIGCPKETGRGLGLKRSQALAVTYSADISVRQETFELKLSYRGGKLYNSWHTLGMPRIRGTHVCFDFFVDKG